jgi:YD repeat-containing protein
MSFRRIRRGRPGAIGVKACAWLALLLASTALITPAMGQQLISNPAEKMMVSPGRVDVRTGEYAYSETDLTIGSEAGGLSLVRMLVHTAGGASPFGTFTHNWDIQLQELTVDRENQREPFSGTGTPWSRVLIKMGGRTRTFSRDPSVIGNPYTYGGVGPQELLTLSGSAYTYTASDGTVVVFRPFSSGDCVAGAAAGCAYAQEMTAPDGTHYTFSYAATGLADGAYRLERVVSSRGYALLLEGSGHQVTKACLLNLAMTALPSSNVCPGNAQATATYSYVTSGYSTTTLRAHIGLASVTGPDGATSSFTYTSLADGAAATMSFIRPGETTPWLVNSIGPSPDYSSYAPFGVYRQDFADGQSYTYGGESGPLVYPGPTNPTIGTSYSAAHGGGAVAHYDWIRRPGYDQPGEWCIHTPCNNEPPLGGDGGDPRIVYQQTPGPVEINLPMGRTTTFDYCDRVTAAGLPAPVVFRCTVGPLQSFTTPDGAKTELDYDAVRNITWVRRIARPGSTQPNGQPWPDIVTTATFDTTHIRSQNKPLSITDANGHTTDYTYDPAHGGLLTETRPAPTSGAPRPQTRHSYAQLYAWLSNGSGGYVQAATPVWVRTATSSCRTSAADPTGTYAPCSAAGDEVLTQYHYGTGDSSHGNTLLLRGQTVTSTDGGVSTTLRTCYGYDAQGRRISETQPNANLTSCP